MAPPMAGMCEEARPPMSCAMNGFPESIRSRAQLRLEFRLAHSSLLRPDILHIQPEDSGKLRQIICVAARSDQVEHAARADRCLLLIVEAVLAHIGILIREEFRAVGRAVEREAHFVEVVAFSSLNPIERGGA